MRPCEPSNPSGLRQRQFSTPRYFCFLLLLIFLLWAPVSAIAQTFKVGSFAKSTGTAPVTQTVTHNLGVTPKALLLWTNGKTNESFAVNYTLGFGMTDGTTSYSIATGSQDNANWSNASRRVAAKAITLVQWGEVTIAEADLQSWTTTAFTLNWTTNNGTAYVIHYLIIGGADVSAKVRNWQMATATGNQSITGIGFQPDLVIHAHSGYNYLTVGNNVTAAAFGLGGMDRYGNQWALQNLAMDASGNSDTQRGQQTNAAIFSFDNALTVQKKAAYVSMDSDGFTLNYSTANANAGQVASLALSGLNAKVGNFLKGTGAAPASQAVSGLGFMPSALILSSFQDVAQANPVASGRFGLGGGDGTTAGSIAVTDTDNMGRTSVDAVSKTSKVFMKVNNDARTINAEANISSMDSNGFTLSWTTNDAVQTQVLYLALGQLRAFGYMKPITIDRTKVGVSGTTNQTLSNYPMLINCADADLKTTANGGRVTSASGYDIVFRSRDESICGGAANSPCQLDHEIEAYDGATGLLTAWVRLPSVNTNAAASNTVIWVYYGNADIVSSVENPTGVWNSNFKGVWHLREDLAGTGTTGLYKDSTLNNEDGDDYVSSTGKEGQIGSGQNFNGTSDYIGIPTGCLTTGATTVSFWLKPNSPPNYNTAFMQGSAGCASHQFRMYWHSGHIEIYRSTTGAAGNPLAASGAITNAVWSHVAWVYDGSTHTFYVNGAASSGTTAGSNLGVGGGIFIGKRDTTNFWSGNLDEVRVSDSNRNADWVKTEYNNQSSPCTFYSLGSEQTAPPTMIRLESFTATDYAGVVQLKWRTGYETGNLGFRLYREDRGKVKRITPSMVAGSALLTRRGLALTSGRTYTWTDRLDDAAAPVQYWLEDVDVKGTSTWHGPVSAVWGDGKLPQGVQSALLSSLGKEGREAGIGVLKWREPGGEAEKGVQQAAGVLLEGREEWGTAQAAALPAGNLAVQWSLAGRAAVKILIRREGWYRVTQPELVAAGLSAGVDPRFLRLYAEGNEQPMVVRGEVDRKFDVGDYIEFYGTGLDTAWTDTRAYWLVADNKVGKRVAVVKGAGARSTARSFQSTVEMKEKSIYWAGLLNGEGENFFGSTVSAEPEDELVVLNHVDGMAPGAALLEVGLQGVTDGTHLVRVQVNGTDAGVVTFKDMSVGTGAFTVPQGLLKTGENAIRLVSLNGEEDISLVSYLRVTYWHTFEADADELQMTVAGNQQVTVGGFSSAGIRVLDVTNGALPQEVTGTIAAGGGGYTVTVGVPGAGMRRVLLLTEGRTRGVEGVRANGPSSWNSQAAGADVVIISHGDFTESVKPLKAQQESEGYTVALVDVEDVYDEYSYGEKTPQGLRDFLLRARGQWKKKPRYLVLVGDASFDPRNYLGFGDFDYVPTRLMDTAYLETASDEWFADFNGDGITDVAVGRLSVRTAAEAAAQVAKVVAYKKGARGESWAKQVVLVADSGNDPNFEIGSERLLWQIPNTLTVREIFRGQMDDAAARNWVLQSLNSGALLVNYFGHGSVELWRGNLLTREDALGLSNGARLPFLVAMTCLNGLFDDVYTESLAEGLMKAPNGGTVGVWASSGLTDPEQQEVVNEELYRQLFMNNQTVGEAVLKAKAKVKDADIRRTWILFGDPTLKLRFP